MNDNDIKKCKKNRHVWLDNCGIILRVDKSSCLWPDKNQWGISCFHATRAAAQAAIDERERKRLARISEYRKSIEPITPEQAKDLRDGDPYYVLEQRSLDGIAKITHYGITEKIGQESVGGYWTREAAEAALAKQKPCDMPDEMCLDGVKCRRLADNEQRKAGDIPVNGSQTHRFGSVWYRPVEFHETPVGETQPIGNETAEEKLTHSVVLHKRFTSLINVLSSQVGGNHYLNKPIQPVLYCAVNGLDDDARAIIKYVTRHGEKGKHADLDKAIQYLLIMRAKCYPDAPECPYSAKAIND